MFGDLESQKFSVESSIKSLPYKESVDAYILQNLLEDLTLKYNILNIHIIAVLVRILMALMQNNLADGLYQFIAQVLILILIFLIYNQIMKRKLMIRQITLLGNLLSLSMITTDLWIVSTIKIQSFETSEAWAVFVVFCWCTIQLLAIVFDISRCQQIVIQMAAIGSIILNFENQSPNAFELRYKIYPLVVIFNVLPILVLKEIKMTKIKLLNEQEGKIGERLAAQKQLINGMSIPALIYTDDQKQYQTENLLLMNSAMQKILRFIFGSNDEWQKIYSESKIQQNNQKGENVDFLKSQDLLRQKIFCEKKTNQPSPFNIHWENETLNGQQETFSLDSLLSLKNQTLSGMNLTVNWPQDAPAKKDFSFCVRIAESTMVNGSKIKIVYFIEMISNNLKHVEEHAEKAALINKTLNHQGQIEDKDISIYQDKFKKSRDYFDLMQRLQSRGNGNFSIEESKFIDISRCSPTDNRDSPHKLKEQQPVPPKFEPILRSETKVDKKQIQVMKSTSKSVRINNSDIELAGVDNNDSQLNALNQAIHQQNSKVSEDNLNSSNLSFEENKFIPNILVSDDNMLELNILESQLRQVIGPDGKKQICTVGTDGLQLVNHYKRRLEATIKSDWQVRPYLVVIADQHMSGKTGLQAAEEIQMIYFDAIRNNSSVEMALHYVPQFIIISVDKNLIQNYQQHTNEYIQFHDKPLRAYKIQLTVGQYLQPLQERALLAQYE